MYPCFGHGNDISMALSLLERLHDRCRVMHIDRIASSIEKPYNGVEIG